MYEQEEAEACPAAGAVTAYAALLLLKELISTCLGKTLVNLNR